MILISGPLELTSLHSSVVLMGIKETIECRNGITMELITASITRSVLLGKLTDEVLSFIKSYIPNLHQYIKKHLYKLWERYILRRVLRYVRLEKAYIPMSKFYEWLNSQASSSYHEEMGYSYYDYKSGLSLDKRRKRVLNIDNGDPFIHFKGSYFKISVGTTHIRVSTMDNDKHLEEVLKDMFDYIFATPHVNLTTIKMDGDDVVQPIRFDSSNPIEMIQPDVKKRIYDVVEQTISYEPSRFPKKCVFGFIGDPGTGKTSAVKMIAQHFGLNVISADSIMALKKGIRSLTIPHIFLLEDFDKFTIEDEDRAYLLNLLDGVGSIDGLIFIFTFNDLASVEKKVYGFSRPGRLDHKIYFKYPTPEEAALYITNLYGIELSEAEVYVDMIVQQNFLLCYASINCHFKAIRGDFSKVTTSIDHFFDKIK